MASLRETIWKLDVSAYVAATFSQQQVSWSFPRPGDFRSKNDSVFIPAWTYEQAIPTTRNRLSPRRSPAPRWRSDDLACLEYHSTQITRNKNLAWLTNGYEIDQRVEAKIRYKSQFTDCETRDFSNRELDMAGDDANSKSYNEKHEGKYATNDSLTFRLLNNRNIKTKTINSRI